MAKVDVSKESIEKVKKAKRNPTDVRVEGISEQFKMKFVVLTYKESNHNKKYYVLYDNKEFHGFDTEREVLHYCSIHGKPTGSSRIKEQLLTATNILALIFSLVYCFYSIIIIWSKHELPNKFEAILMVMVGYIFANVTSAKNKKVSNDEG